MKTPKEFDYDLWITDDGKCMVRVKSTGEVTEVDRDVMRLLRAEERKMRRSFIHNDSENDESTLSLEAICYTDELNEAGWLIDTNQDVESETIGKSISADFMKLLTPKQAEVYKSCIVGGLGIREYARLHKISHVTALEMLEAIRKKFRKYFS